MSHQDDSRPDRIQFFYAQSPDYRVVAANAALGGPTPHGELVVEFIFERAMPPPATEHRVTPEGKLGDAIQPPATEEGTAQLERYAQFAVVLSPDRALEIAKWMEGHARKLLDAEEQER